MRYRIALAMLLVRVAPIHAQAEWWRREVVLSPDTVAQFRFIEGVEYKGASAHSPRLDVYIPKTASGASRPGVILIHGGPIPADLPVDARGMGQYQSLARLLVAGNIEVIAVAHRLNDAGSIDSASNDVLDAVRFVFAHANDWGLDPTRVCLWTISAGGVVVGPTLRELGDHIHCLVVYYGVFTPNVFRAVLRDSTVRAVATVAATQLIRDHRFRVPPTFVVRAGLDNPLINADLDAFVAAAIESRGDVEIHALPQAHHAFDILDDTPESRRTLRRTVQFLQEQAKVRGGVPPDNEF